MEDFCSKLRKKIGCETMKNGGKRNFKMEKNTRANYFVFFFFLEDFLM